MKTTLSNILVLALLLAAGTAGAEEICDFTINPEARDGHTPADPARFFTVCSSSRFEAHPSAVMLPDDKTILAFWDIQQAGPCGSAAVSTDAGRTWTRIDDRLPKEFSACHDTPRVWRFVDPKTGKGRIRVFASYGTADEFDWRGADDRPLAEAMPSVMSEDDGATWKLLPPLGADFACVIGFSGMVRLDDGSYLGVFSRGKNPNGDGGDYRVMGSFSRDGGLTWEKPFVVAEKDGCQFLLPTVFRSPDGKELCCLVGNARRRPDWEGVHGETAWACVSTDEGKTWSAPVPTEKGIAGSEHVARVLPDGRVIVAFRQRNALLGWTGSYKALFRRDAEAYEARLVHNYGDDRTVGSPNLFVRKAGEVVVIAHAQFDLHRPMPAIVAMRFETDEIERTIRGREQAKKDFEGWSPFAGTAFKPLDHAKLYGPFAQETVMKDKKEHTLIPFDGKKSYIEKAAGPTANEMSSANGTYEISKHANRRRGNAAIAVWTVRVPADVKARLRVIASPTARWCVNGKCVMPPVCATIFDRRTAEISLKKGDNDISVMVYQPQDRSSSERGFSGLPMRLAAALDLKDFSCVQPEKKIEIKSEDDLSLDDELEI